jgi:hypothetical protein
MRFSRQSLYHVPILGWLAKDAVHGRPDAKYYLLANVLALVAFLIYEFGYAFVIILALAGTAGMLAFLIYLTASDVFAKRPPKSSIQSAAPVARRVRRADRMLEAAE